MTIIHKSKVGLEVLVPLVVILVPVTVVMAIQLIWIGVVVCGLITLFLVSVYARTDYKITRELLLIRCGFFYVLDIKVSDIVRVRRSNELSNAPALSVDRLEVIYGGGRVLISPRNKLKFVNDLKTVNPAIDVAGV